MASDITSTAASGDDEDDQSPKIEPLTPAKRKMLQKCYEQGTTVSAKGSYKYAHQMFTQCVIGDPSNLVYFQSLLENLYKKYKNNRKKVSKLASLKSGSTKTAIKKALGKDNWAGAVKAAATMLDLNPWDAPTLLSVADVMEKMENTGGQVFFCRAAIEADAKSAGNNRRVAASLVRAAQYELAIACWHRIRAAKPNDAEAAKMIADLSVERTIHEGGYEDAETSVDVAADRTVVGGGAKGSGEVTREDRLLQAIRDNSDQLSAYLELADLYTRDGKFSEAEEILEKAMQVTGGDMNVRERIEDVQLQRARQQVLRAAKRLEAKPSDKAKKLVKKLKVELNRTEIEIFGGRVERYPSNYSLKYELGLRLKKFAKFNEAIGYFQDARHDRDRKGEANLALGECFQHIERFPLAMNAYDSAIEASAPKEGESHTQKQQETYKSALYRAGRLATGLGDLDTADKHLTALAELDFAYKDISDRLDKLAKLRNKG